MNLCVHLLDLKIIAGNFPSFCLEPIGGMLDFVDLSFGHVYHYVQVRVH